MNILVIYNPISGLQAKNIFQSPVTYCKKELDKKKIKYHWYTTLPVEKQNFDEIDFTSFDRAMVIGGDGTVREFISYLLKNNIKIPVAIIPAGTANLLAYSLGIPLFSVSSAFNLAVNGKAICIDTGIVNEKEYFIIGCGKGHDAMVMKTAKRSLKKSFGVLAYLFASIAQLFHFSRIKYKVEVDGKIYKFKARTVVVFNMLNLFNFKKKYNINHQDGLLNIIVLQASAFWSIGRLLMKLIQGRGYEKKSGIKSFTGKKITIYAKQRNIPVEIDGDVFHLEHLTIRILPQSVCIIASKP